MHLSPDHLKLLKQIRKGTVVRTDKNDLEDVEYLRAEGLTIACCVDKPNDFFYQPRITEKGKDVLHQHFIHGVESWLPVIISNAIAAVALIISIIALCTK